MELISVPASHRAVRTWSSCAVALMLAAAAQAAEQTQVVVDSHASSDASPAAAARPEQRRAVEFTWKDRPSFEFGDRLRIDLRARVHTGASRLEAEPGSTGDAPDLDKRRVGVEGSFGTILRFEVTRELAHSRPWRDAYLDYRQFSTARVQFGRFKLPFSLDENTGAGSQDFVNRSMAASALAPGRDRGVMFHGRLWRRTLSYEAGIFAHDGDNARVRDEMSLAAGRTAALRLATAIGGKSGLHAAVAVASSNVPATIWTIRGRTPLEETFFPAALWVQGARLRVGVEARWVAGPVSLQSEYIRLTQERLFQSVRGGTLDPVVATGWYVSGTWAVTGERKGQRLRSQARSVFHGGRGAVEVAARLEALTFGQVGEVNGASVSSRAETVLGNRNRALTLGLNWYLSPHLRLQGNVIRDALRDPWRGSRPAQPAYWSSVLRLQVGM